MSDKNRKVIMVTGLDNPAWQMWPIVRRWRVAGLEVEVFDPKWKNGRLFRFKFRRLLRLIDQQPTEKKLILVGISAGGSAVLNAYMKRKEKIDRVVTVCSQLRKSKTFDNTTLALSKAFRRSVYLNERNIPKFKKGDLNKIMTVRSMLGDELVPTDTAALLGAHNIMVPTGEHVFSIFCALTFFSGKIISFIWQDLERKSR